MWHELAEFQLQVSILGHLSVGCQSTGFNGRKSCKVPVACCWIKVNLFK